VIKKLIRNPTEFLMTRIFANPTNCRIVVAGWQIEIFFERMGEIGVIKLIGPVPTGPDLSGLVGVD